jgi:hypothetical protein
VVPQRQKDGDSRWKFKVVLATRFAPVHFLMDSHQNTRQFNKDSLLIGKGPHTAKKNLDKE